MCRTSSERQISTHENHQPNTHRDTLVLLSHSRRENQKSRKSTVKHPLCSCTQFQEASHSSTKHPEMRAHNTLQSRGLSGWRSEVTLPALGRTEEIEVPIRAASVLQSELKVSPTALGGGREEGCVQLGSQESDMFLFQNLRFLAPWEMQALGKTAGCGGKSPAQELSPRLASHQPPSGNTMANTHHRLAAPTWGNPGHCPHISEGLPWGSSLLRGGSGALLDQGATRPSPTSSPQFWEVARSLRVSFTLCFVGRAARMRSASYPGGNQWATAFRHTPRPLLCPALSGSEMWLGKSRDGQLPLLLFG